MTISSHNLEAGTGPEGVGPVSSLRFHRVAVIDPDTGRRAGLARQLRQGPDTRAYPDVAALEASQPRGEAVVVVFGPGMANAVGLAEIDAFTRAHPEAAAILVAAELSTALFQQALRCGVRDVLGAPADDAALAESVDRVSRTLPLPPPSAVPSEPEPPRSGRVVTVSSMKGGSGKTVVATNLATVLARRTTRPVVLVDGDLQFGDAAVMLCLSAPHTLIDAVSAQGQLDTQYLESLLIRHDPSGLLVLPAPVEPLFAERIQGADVVRVVEALRKFAAYVVIDTPAQFNDVVLSLVEYSDDILMVASMDVPNIKNTKLGLQTLRMLGVPGSKVMLLINRANSRVELDVSEVERTLGMKADLLIPSAIAVPQAVNRGVPVVLDAPRSDVSRCFEQLAEHLSGRASAPSPFPKKPRGLFRSLAR